LRPLAEAALELDREFTPEQILAGRPSAPQGSRAVEDEFTILGPVRFRGTLTRAGDRFHLRGRILATLQLNCGRCLTPFPTPVDTEVDLTYVPDKPPAGTAAKDAKAPAEEEVELLDEDLNTSYYHDHVLDLGEMLREQFYLALPMQPLCRPDCQGLCPVCGKDRNVEPCQCQTEWVDPRLAGLKALVNRKSD
jgi:uncharacterized protein